MKKTKMIKKSWPVIFSVILGMACTMKGAAQLSTVKDIPMSGGANRFDYQSIDPVNRRLYIAHMNSNAVVVFDLDKQQIVANIENISRPTGVLAVPELGKVYVSASHSNEVVVIDERSLEITKRIQSGRFPDGLAYEPNTRRIYVSDESGRQVTVIDAQSDKFITNIGVDGEVGNTHYNPITRKIYSAVQTKNQLICIDPTNNKIIDRFDLKGCDQPHGFLIDPATNYALITGESGQFIVFDLATNKIIYSNKVGRGPDVLAFDAALYKLYVSSESGVISVFSVQKNAVKKISEGFVAEKAHTISVDPKTHFIYLPLERVNGKPVLRVATVKE